MNGISGTDSILANLQLQQAEAKSNRTSLGQEEFLALMITQLKNQDPMKPLENGEFIGQMAQFSTVAGIGEMSKSVANLSDTFRAGQALQAASIVGRTVLSESDSGVLTADGQLSGAVDVPYGASGVSVRIHGQDGALVRQLALGPQGAGLANFSWDGTLANGDSARPGTYFISAAVTTSEGEAGADTYVSSSVQSITLDGNGSNTLLTTDSGSTIRLSDVKAIR